MTLQNSEVFSHGTTSAVLLIFELVYLVYLH